MTGWVSGVQIYNNTFYSNPAIPSAAFLANANPGSDSRLFENNIIYSAVPQMIQTPTGYTLDNNIYWATSTSSPTWQWNGVTYTDFSAYQSASGQDAQTYNADPMLNDPTSSHSGPTKFRIHPTVRIAGSECWDQCLPGHQWMLHGHTGLFRKSSAEQQRI